MIFYLFAAITVISAIFVVTTKNVVHSAFYLLFTLFGIAGLYITLGADFVGIVQLIVYVGGILILILFGVMLTNKVTSVQIKTGTVQLLPASVAVGVLAGFIIYIFNNTSWFTKTNAVTSTSTLTEIGTLFMNQYAVAFELLGIVLLIALIGAASMARK
jgi:NADH-quinone oxidoreductase subunit J